MKHIHIFIIHLFFFIHPLCAQTSYFQNYYGTPGSDAGRGVTQLSNGDIFIAGYSSVGQGGTLDFTVSKISKNGILIWMKFYGDSLNNYALGITQSKDGNLIICGETEVGLFDKDAFVSKVDTAGNLKWQKTFGNFQNQSFKSIETTSDGGYITCGFTTDLSNSNDIYFVKLDSMGNQQWTGTIGGSFNDVGDAIHQTSDGGYIITGDSNSNNSSNYDVEITKLDSAGNVVWDNFFGDSLTNGCQGILPLRDGSFLSYGETEIAPNSPFDFFMQKIDSGGNSVFHKTFGGLVSDALFSAIEDSIGNFYFTGYSNSYHSGPLDLVFGKTDSLANLQWIKTFGDSSIDIGYGIIQAKDSGFYIIGNGYHNGSDDFFLVYANDSLMQVGIADNVPYEPNLIVLPNPCSGSFSIDYSKMLLNDFTLAIYTLSGGEILYKQIHNTVAPLLVNLTDNLANGFYFLKLFDSANCYYSKICIQK